MAVQFTYDPTADAALIQFGEGPSTETTVAGEGLNLDFNARGELIAIEVLNVSRTAPSLMATAQKAVAAA